MAAKGGWSIGITTKGPVLTGKAAAMVRPYLIRPALEEVSMETAKRLWERFTPRPGGVFLSVAQAQKGKASTGKYRKWIHVWERTPTMWKVDDNKCINGPWLEGTSSRNQSTRFKGYGTFRKTKDWAKKNVVPAVMEKRIEAFVKLVG
jgi:hypothetical protein